MFGLGLSLGLVGGNLYSKGPFPTLYPHLNTKNWLFSTGKKLDDLG